MLVIVALLSVFALFAGTIGLIFQIYDIFF